VLQYDLGWHEQKLPCEKLKLIRSRPEVSSFIYWVLLCNVVKKIYFFPECLNAAHWVRRNVTEQKLRTIDWNNSKFTETRIHHSLAEILIIRHRRTQYHTNSRCKLKA
jgi:hypothetical protein